MEAPQHRRPAVQSQGVSASAQPRTELQKASEALAGTSSQSSSAAAVAQYEHMTAGMSQKHKKAYLLKQRADEARIQQLRGIFAAYDEDRNGLLNDVELAQAMLALGMDPNPKQMQRFQLLSPQPGGVDLATFVKVCMSRVSSVPGSSPLPSSDTSRPAVLELFKRFDEKGTGKVPLALLLHILAEVSAPSSLSMVEVQDLLRMSGILTPAVASDPRLLYQMEIDVQGFTRLMSFV